MFSRWLVKKQLLPGYRGGRRPLQRRLGDNDRKLYVLRPASQYKAISGIAELIDNNLEIQAMERECPRYPACIMQVPPLDSPGHFFPMNTEYQEEASEEEEVS